MIEYWAFLGLAIIDEELRHAIAEVKSDPESLRKIVKDYGFRLSRYEFGELQRVINSKDTDVSVLDLMDKIHTLIWVHRDPCWPAMTPNPGYRHPYLVLEHQYDRMAMGIQDIQETESGIHVPGFVDPVTGEPLKRDDV